MTVYVLLVAAALLVIAYWVLYTRTAEGAAPRGQGRRHRHRDAGEATDGTYGLVLKFGAIDPPKTHGEFCLAGLQEDSGRT